MPKVPAAPARPPTREERLDALEARLPALRQEAAEIRKRVDDLLASRAEQRAVPPKETIKEPVAVLLADTARAAVNMIGCVRRWETANRALESSWEGDVPEAVFVQSGLDAVIDILVEAGSAVCRKIGTTGLDLDIDDLVRAWQVAAGPTGRAEAKETEATRLGCACRWATIENHDWLLGVDTLPFPQLVEELQNFACQAADPADRLDPTEVPWFEFSTFVAHHNWTHPEAMYYFAEIVEEWLQPQPKAAS
ncbi:MAG: hypothetical protein ACYDH6_08690 [Acidimicrobiales bacterium]